MARNKKPSGSGESHSLDSLGRRRSTLRPRLRVLVLCGGEQTEPRYFQCVKRELRLSNRTVDVEVVGKRFAPRKLMDHARRRLNPHATRDPFDEVWCVMDREANNEPEGFGEVVNAVGNQEVELAISNPAFEFWFLLHFVSTDKPFEDADHLVHELKNYIPDYEKNSDVFTLVWKQTDDAIGRAKGLYENRPDPDDPFPNPSTGVHWLVERLKDLAAFR